MSVELADIDRAACYRALRTRDRRFDGRFFTGVVSTGIFCRPICPAPVPKLENCVFLPSAAAAFELGFRPCLRCRPEVAPGLAGWRGSESTIARALRLIVEGAVDDGGVDALAERLGVGARHLRRLFERYVGAAPISVVQAHRVLFAKKLLAETSLSMTDVALASGFGSVRRFNDAFRSTYARAPSELRKKTRALGGDAPGVTITLPFVPPYDFDAVLGFLEPRAIPDVERVRDGRYFRTFELHGATGTVEVRRGDAHHLLAVIRASDVSALGSVASRLRRLFDLDADAAAIDAHLARDPLLYPLVRARPGVRVPGAWDDFELAVRAVLGQQVSVRAATTFAGRVAAFGEKVTIAFASEAAGRVFPSPEKLAHANLDGVGLTRARTAALTALAKAAAADDRWLAPRGSLDDTVRALTSLPGIGPWTAEYIAMRALREPDALPSTDLGLRRAMSTGETRPSPRALLQRAEPWRPWRAYAAMRLWLQGA